MVTDYKSSQTRKLRNILLIILFITFIIGAWRIFTDTSPKGIQEADKVFQEEKNLEK
ncbi:hypothetical protein [Halodesulfovibrio spirochaetisodalis]|uniref:hypothetical protein n=1 Tax=Halodesulfovibrio spirochaetisodalis TaxID=1560234 RepID=UPI000A6DA343|nr:hypothetical protein [Halodesulfovibrio spirochaetisodalis]